MMEDNKYLVFRVPKLPLLIFLVSLFVLASVEAYNNWPRYIVLDPPLPANVFITSEERTIYIPYTSGDVRMEHDKSWQWRKEFMFLPFVEDLNTSETILGYYHKYLEEQGWVKYEEQGFPCGDMREADFLERGKNLFVYVPKNSKSPYFGDAVCLAIWSFTTADDRIGFNVLLFTTAK